MKIAQIMIAVLLILTGCTSIAEEDRALITENRELAVQAQEVSLQALNEVRAMRQDINKLIALHK
jgi:uncharacterized lipoprotein NlpE involved in copper resistance